MLRRACGGSPARTTRCAPSACAACSARARSARRACCSARRARCGLRARWSRRWICGGSPSSASRHAEAAGCCSSPSASPRSSSSVSMSRRGGAHASGRENTARRVFLGDRPDEHDGAGRRALRRGGRGARLAVRGEFLARRRRLPRAPQPRARFRALRIRARGLHVAARARGKRRPNGLAEAGAIEPEDFTAEQAYRLAVAFGGEQELAQALMDRVCAWTGGHPYLTQRVARGVARKGGRLEDVERVVREQLLAPEAAEPDPLLLTCALGSASRRARRGARRRLLHKLAAGGKVAQPADAAVAERLWLSGTVASMRSGGCASATASSRSSSRRVGSRRSSGASVARRGRRVARRARGRRLLVHAASARRRHRDVDGAGR